MVYCADKCGTSGVLRCNRHVLLVIDILFAVYYMCVAVCVRQCTTCHLYLVVHILSSCRLYLIIFCDACLVMHCAIAYIAVLQCIALQHTTYCALVCPSLWGSGRIAMYCNVLRCIAMCCNVLRCIAMYCNVLRCIAMYCLLNMSCNLWRSVL